LLVHHGTESTFPAPAASISTPTTFGIDHRIEETRSSSLFRLALIPIQTKGCGRRWPSLVCWSSKTPREGLEEIAFGGDTAAMEAFYCQLQSQTRRAEDGGKRLGPYPEWKSYGYGAHRATWRQLTIPLYCARLKQPRSFSATFPSGGRPKR